MYANGYPVALLANADERESLGLMSIATYLSESGSRAYCMLHSPTMPTCFVARNAAERTYGIHDYQLFAMVQQQYYHQCVLS